MLHRLLTLTLIWIWISCPTQAQTDEFTLGECAKAYFSSNNNDLEKQQALRECVVGKKFPTFSATTITGKKYSNTDIKGKVVFITSWFTTCPPCLAEMPILNELNEKYKDKEFLLLSFSPDDDERIRKFLKERPITYEIFPNSEGLIQYRIQTNYGYPTNIIVNKKGEIVEFRTGSPLDQKGLAATKNDFAAIIERELAK